MGGICGAGIRRMADALTRALGGESISLILPATAMANDAAGQLGLVDPGVQEVILSPVVIRKITTGNLGPRRRVEFTVPASTIERELPGVGMGTAEDLFKAALGLTYVGDLFHIEQVAPESFAGNICFFVITAVE
jgi:hypothetical protein